MKVARTDMHLGSHLGNTDRLIEPLTNKGIDS
jgi:hypothetical protein